MNELSVEARALIERVGLADGPSAVRRARVKRHLVAALASAGVGIGGVAPAAAASAHAGAAGLALGTVASKSALTLGSVAVWLAAGVGLGTLVSTPALIVRLQQAEERNEAAAAAAPAPKQPAKPAAAAPAPAPAPEPRSAALATPPVAERPERAASAAATGPAAPVSPVPTLAEETRVLEGAQRALASGHATEALALLDEHAARFPAGALGEERSAARILSLCALGRAAEAQSAAALFVAASPRSPLLPRLRGSCALAGAGEAKGRR